MAVCSWLTTPTGAVVASSTIVSCFTLLAAQDASFLLDVVVTAYQRRASQRAAINAMPLYPTEGLLWDTTQIPTAAYSGERPLALPKLNLQFLSPADYLLRNFHLFRLEAAYEVREDIEVRGNTPFKLHHIYFMVSICLIIKPFEDMKICEPGPMDARFQYH